MATALARGRGPTAATAAGIVVGGAVADAFWHSVQQAGDFDPDELGTGGELACDWAGVTDSCLSVAEELLRGAPLPIDLTPSSATAAAIHAALDGRAPLLADPAASPVFDAVADMLDCGNDPAGSYVTAVRAAVDSAAPLDEVVLVGALEGGRVGLAGIPARWASSVTGPVGTNRYALHQCRRLAERLLGLDRVPMRDPNRRVSAREVAPQLWLTNLWGVGRFLEEHPDSALISLCPMTSHTEHRCRREFTIVDSSARTENPTLRAVLAEVLDTIDTFHAEGREVLVHCRYGRSRTGLVLRGWLMRHEALGEPDATAEAQARWPHTTVWNRHFTEVLSSAG